MADIGFIGLGIMGRPMVRNLMKAGNTVTVYDIVGTAVEEMATEGAKVASSSKEVAEGNKLIITMVPDGPDAEAAIMGPNGVLEGAAAGSVVIDMSSIAPASSQKIGAACDAADVGFLDAPVSGGEPGAVAGTLAIMVGGKKDVYDSYVDTFAILGSSTYCGGYGAGNTTKLANQIIVALNIAAVGEALVLSRKAGLDPEVVFNAIKGGLAGSTVLNAKAPMMIEGNFNPGFRVRLHQKDLNNALQTARELDVPLPFTAMVQQVIGSLMNEGKGDLDHSAIANFIEDMAQTKISGQ